MRIDETEIIRPARSSDIAQLGALFAEVFGESRDAAVWRWKYFDNPRGTFSFVCEAAGNLIAHCGGTPIVMQDGARRYIALQSVDFMSSRRYAGGMGKGGVFARMVNAFFAEYCGAGKVEMVYGFPGERHRAVGERILGYSPVEVVGEIKLPLSPRSAGRSALQFHPLDGYLALLSQDRPQFGGLRDRDYLRWRYILHPLHRYEAVVVTRWPWRRPVAAAIVRETDTELLLMESRIGDGAADARRLADVLGAGGKEVRGWAPLLHSRTQRLLESGFEFRERDHRLEVRFFNGRGIPVAGELDYSLGDYDVY